MLELLRDQIWQFVGAAVGMVAVMVSALSIIGTALPAEHSASAEAALQQQMGELDQVKGSLEDLLVFVQDQQDKLISTQELVDELEAEKAQLEPIVQTQREVIDGIFRIQEQRSKRERWVDRGIGFLAGFVTEVIVAVFVAPWFVRVLRGRRESAEPSGDS